MSTADRLLLNAALLAGGLLITLCAGAADGGSASRSPGLGEPLPAERVAELDLTVMADGAGLPPGGGNARAGAAVYAAHCQACHGPGGRGGPNDALVGGRNTLTSDDPRKTIGSFWPYAPTVFDYVRRAMPYQAPGSLTDDEVYAVTAYLLAENGIIEPSAEMNARTLPAVVMPNRDGFRVIAPGNEQASAHCSIF